MSQAYIPRTLISDRGREDERVITEADIPSINAPIVILGDPGLGKTELTKALEARFGFQRVAGGVFYRNQNIQRYTTPPDSKLIIDGLDEITSSSGISAIDEILKKLSERGNPNFILSCRSADWQGSTDRYKISEDYGTEPVTLHLQPFTYEDATAFLKSYDDEIEVELVLDYLDEHDLREFYINPLTLTLVAEIATAGEGLPKGRGDLLDRASKLLTSEKNPVHQRSVVAQSNRDTLLDSAGAALAHLIISGSIGFTDRPREKTPEGFIHTGELNDIADAPLIAAALKTRLFQSPDENLYIPFHRVVAEFLGARWLNRRLSNGLSERRLFQTLVFDDGIPTAFRGLHAWLAHFSPRFAARCIKADPYGVLRYGDPDQLPLDQARLLLNSLASLANEDPYFRSEDWGRRAVSGLARPELKDEVIAIITGRDRPIHLSMLLLEALQGSPLAGAIADELITIVENPTAAYAERSRAAEALFGGSVEIDWTKIAEALRTRSQSGDKRLVLEIIGIVGGKRFSGKQIATAILEYKPSSLDDDEDPYVSGMVYQIVEKISSRVSGQILDQIVEQHRRGNKTDHGRLGYELSSAVNQLIDKAVQQNEKPSPERVWSWLKLTENETGYSESKNRPITDWLMKNQDLRRQIQRNAINASKRSDGPWIAIVHDLPLADPGLAFTTDDAVALLTDTASKEVLSEFDANLWIDVIRSQQTRDDFPDEIKTAVSYGTGRHPVLFRQWQQLTAAPKRDWDKEEKDRAIEQTRLREKRFSEHRAIYLPRLENIASGTDVGALAEIAKAYLGRYVDFNQEKVPELRVREWLGRELADAALAGFVASLSREDLPSVAQIAETHANGKHFFIELVLICGIAEMVRTGQRLDTLTPAVAAAALAAWWEEADRFDENARSKLENVVFSSEQAIEDFSALIVEPRIRSGHQHIPGLHRITHDRLFRAAAARLSLKWLENYPTASPSIQAILAKTAIDYGLSQSLVSLTRERALTSALDTEAQRLWISVAFVVDFENSKKICSTYFHSDKQSIWSAAELIHRERRNNRVSFPLTIEQREFLICAFGPLWPSVQRPSSSAGSSNPWDAADFIRFNISAIGSDPSAAASDSLNRLVSFLKVSSYHDYIKHIRALQTRLRRDTEFRTSSFGQIKETLAGKLPGGIDDLKAIILDRLELVRDYIRNGDTDTWESFWNGTTPKDENTCRNRLLDLLRPQTPIEVNFLPEITMPEVTRADIVAIYLQYGVPVEIKGQWHKNVWDAASVQLIERYARDWRADDRGIYLVIWFGNVRGKNLPKHPDGLAPPSSPEELRSMLIDRLAVEERTRIDIFILDVSKR